MNLSPRWEAALQGAGFDAVHWSAIGPLDASDPAIMQYAADHGYVVLTHDLDFGAILASTLANRPSVVQIRSENVSVAGIGQQVLAALHQLQPDLDQGALVTIEPSRTRARVLPFRSA
jgi:predicted nuclease of predicted toxin-antitoxin system